MPVTERALHNLVKKLDEVLGPENTDTLMALLLPDQWDREYTATELVGDRRGRHDDCRASAN